MDLENEKCVRRKNQLQVQVAELFAENKILANKISVLNECLSLEKVKRKITVLENKQKMLKSFEDMVNKLKTDIIPLEYLKQLLQKQLVGSSLCTDDDYTVKEPKNTESSQLTVTKESSIEIFDVLSDDNSEESVDVLSDDDVVVLDIEDFNCTTISKVKTMDEALMDASLVHSITRESPITSIGSIEPSPIVHSISKDSFTFMSSSGMSEHLLNMFDIVNDQELLDDSEYNKIHSEYGTGKFESTVPELNQLHITKEKSGNAAIKQLESKECDGPLSTVLNSWVQVNKFKLVNTSIKNTEQECEDLLQDKMLQKVSTEVSDCESNDQLCYYQSESKDTSNIKRFEDGCYNMDFGDKNIISNPVFSTNNPKYELLIQSSMLNSEDSCASRKCDSSKVNAEVCEAPKKFLHVKNDQLCNLFESNKFFNNENSENIDSYVDHIKNRKIEMYDTVCSNNVQKGELIVKTPLFNTDIEGSSLIEDVNDLSANFNVEPTSNSDCEKSTQPRFTNENKKVETYDPVCSNSIQKNELLVKTPLFNADIGGSSLTKDVNDLSANFNIESSSNSDNQPCSTKELSTVLSMCLNVNLLKGIYQHGYQNLTPLQLKCLSHCMNKQDLIFYSNPYVGKTTMCLISVLQMINTSLNECQAVVLVPTSELALSAQKLIKSLGKFLNVSTCIGGTNVPQVSPVPHVVVSTLGSLCDMINCNSLCKDFIKMLVVDDADEMFKCYGFPNHIRNVLRFLNSGCQLVIVSTSKLDEIFDQFSDMMHNPEFIIMSDEKPFLEDISQYYINVSQDWKFDAVCELYELLCLERAVVYCNSWNTSLGIAENMRFKTYTVSAVHNEMDTRQRQLILEQFRTGTSKLLITTGLLRGEDFLDVAWVINYDLPKNPNEYVRRVVGGFKHRVKVINFITTDDTIAKKNIETAFKIQMFYFPQGVIDLYS